MKLFSARLFTCNCRIAYRIIGKDDLNLFGVHLNVISINPHSTDDLREENNKPEIRLHCVTLRHVE